MTFQALKTNQANLFERIGAEVSYQKFNDSPGNVDALGDIIDQEASYPNSVTLKAIIEYAPSMAMRSKLGLSEDVLATMELLTSELDEKGVTVTTADRFILPDSSKPYYVDKVAPQQQLENEFLTYLIALTRKRGGKRNR